VPKADLQPHARQELSSFPTSSSPSASAAQGPAFLAQLRRFTFVDVIHSQSCCPVPCKLNGRSRDQIPAAASQPFCGDFLHVSLRPLRGGFLARSSPLVHRRWSPLTSSLQFHQIKLRLCPNIKIRIIFYSDQFEYYSGMSLPLGSADLEFDSR
jgi:hypothetical protein